MSFGGNAPSYRWIEESKVTSKTGKDGNTEYTKLEMIVNDRKDIIEVNDSVLLYSDDIETHEKVVHSKLDTFVARIEKMWEEPAPAAGKRDKNRKGGKADEKEYSEERKMRMKIRARWYFKKKDLQEIGGTFAGLNRRNFLNAMTPQALILGEQTDDNEVSTILAKCQVLRRRPIAAAGSLDATASTSSDSTGAAPPHKLDTTNTSTYICSYTVHIPKKGEEGFGTVIIRPYDGPEDPLPAPATPKTEPTTTSTDTAKATATDTGQTTQVSKAVDTLSPTKSKSITVSETIQTTPEVSVEETPTKPLESTSPKEPLKDPPAAASTAASDPKIEPTQESEVPASRKRNADEIDSDENINVTETSDTEDETNLSVTDNDANGIPKQKKLKPNTDEEDGSVNVTDMNEKSEDQENVEKTTSIANNNDSKMSENDNGNTVDVKEESVTESKDPSALNTSSNTKEDRKSIDEEMVDATAISKTESQEDATIDDVDEDTEDKDTVETKNTKTNSNTSSSSDNDDEDDDLSSSSQKEPSSESNPSNYDDSNNPKLPKEGAIHVGPNHQATVPPFPSDLSSRPSSSSSNKNKKQESINSTLEDTATSPIPVWKPGGISDEDMDQFVSDAAVVLKKYMSHNDIETVGMPSSSIFMGVPGDEKKMSSQPNVTSTKTASEPTPTETKTEQNQINERKPRPMTRECNEDRIIQTLHECSYDTLVALEKIRKDPLAYLTIWDRNEKESFNNGFRRYRGSLRSISKGVSSKTYKDVVDYHYRFKIPYQFRKYQDKKREQARKMMGAMVEKDNGSDAGSSGGNKKSRHWTKFGASEQRKIAAKQFLIQVRETIGSENYLLLASQLKLYQSKSQNVAVLKENVAPLLRANTGLLDRFLEFLPKKYRA